MAISEAALRIEVLEMHGHLLELWISDNRFGEDLIAMHEASGDFQVEQSRLRPDTTGNAFLHNHFSVDELSKMSREDKFKASRDLAQKLGKAVTF